MGNATASTAADATKLHCCAPRWAGGRRECTKDGKTCADCCTARPGSGATAAPCAADVTALSQVGAPEVGQTPVVRKHGSGAALDCTCDAAMAGMPTDPYSKRPVLRPTGCSERRPRLILNDACVVVVLPLAGRRVSRARCVHLGQMGF